MRIMEFYLPKDADSNVKKPWDRFLYKELIPSITLGISPMSREFSVFSQFESSVFSLTNYLMVRAI